MRFLKKIVCIILLAILSLYIGLTIYFKIVAKDLVNASIQTLLSTYPHIKHISYDSVRFSPYDFLNKTLSIHKISISFADSDMVLNIDNLSLHNYMAFKQEPIGSFNVSFTNLTINSPQNLYAFLATASNNAYMYSELGNLPARINFSINGGLNYNAINKLAGISLNAFANNQSILNDQTVFINLPLNANFFNHFHVFLNTLRHSAVLESNYQLHVNHIISLQDIESAIPSAGNFLQNLGYNALPVEINVSSHYQGGQKQENFQAHIVMTGLGTLNLHWRLLFNAPLSPYDFAKYWLNPSAPPPANSTVRSDNNPPLIASAQIFYTDQSFVNRLLAYLATTMNQPIANVQGLIQTILTTYASTTNIPSFTVIAAQIINFIANPGTLSFYLKPAVPFNINDIVTFFNTQQQQNSLLIKQMQGLSDNQKSALFNRYESATAQAYSSFFNHIGLSIIANQMSVDS